MAQKTIFAFFLSMAMVFSSCSEDSTSPSTYNNSNPGSVSCKVNGSAWTGVNSTFNNILNIDAVAGDQFILDAKDENNTRIIFTANGSTAGTYQLDVPNSVFNAGASLQIDVNGSRVVANSKTATINISSIDQNNKTASGTFSFTSDDDKYVITEGKFSGVSFTIK